MADKQQQEEELLILKSILSDSIVDLGSESDQFEIDVDFQLSAPFYLRFVNESHEYSTLIQHIPPIILTVYFHDQYPSSVYSPTFVLSSCYLTRRHLKCMCKNLDLIWEQNLSQPIVFQWIDYLKEYFLSTHELRISSEPTDDDDDDPRAMSSYQPDRAAYVYEQLIEYNRFKETETFLHGYHECPICLTTNIPGRDMIRLHKCHHFFCLDCLHDYAKLNIDTGSVQWLLCPDTQCQLALLPTEVKTIVKDDQLYDKYERLLLQKTLEQMSDVVWCPRCQQAVLAGDENDNLAFCNQCSYAFCKKCRKIYHSQTLCGRDLELAMLRERNRKIHNKIRSLQLTSEDAETLLHDFLTVARIESSARLCPNRHCGVPIEKNMGCDHMYCTHCHQPFNWSEAVIPSTETSVLFEKYEKDLDNVYKVLSSQNTTEENVGDRLTTIKESIVSELLLKRIKECPNANCRKVNVKSGISNYLICRYCKRGYCFLCGRSVINPRDHYGTGCKR